MNEMGKTGGSEKSAGLPFRLTGWAAWSPDCETPQQWAAWADGGSDNLAESRQQPLSERLPLAVRRRTKPIGRSALSAATALQNVADARYVLSTRHGEFERTVSILDSLIERETPSPADFSMSVHHSLAGLLSIAMKNTQGHTAVSAGPESFCFGMLEAAACLAERPEQPVILIHYDELPGGGFADLLPPWETQLPIVMAIGICDLSADQGEAITVSSEPSSDASPSECAARDFLRFLLTGAKDGASIGNRHNWHWRRA